MQEYVWVILVDGKFVRVVDETMQKLKTPRLSRASFFKSKADAEYVGQDIPHRVYRRVVIGLMP